MGSSESQVFQKQKDIINSLNNKQVACARYRLEVSSSYLINFPAKANGETILLM